MTIGAFNVLAPKVDEPERNVARYQFNPSSTTTASTTSTSQASESTAAAATTTVAQPDTPTTFGGLEEDEESITMQMTPLDINDV